MNLIVFNMANVFDWQKGIVNRNFFIVRELLRSQQYKQVLLVDFLAIRSVERFFGIRRTLRYVSDCYGPLLQKKRVGKRHVLWNAKEVFGVENDVWVLSGLGLSRCAQADRTVVKNIKAELGFTAESTDIWSYNAFLPEVMDMPGRSHIFDAVDDWSLHASYKREVPLLQKNYAKIGQSADLIFTVSEGLLKKFDAKKSHWIPNGVDTDVFRQSAIRVPDDIATVRHPVIGYVGTVQERIDFSMLETVCAAHPQSSFVFIGPVWKGVRKEADRLMRVCPNVQFLGRRAYEQIPSYLAAMDVAMIPHRLDDFIGTTNPMKMYDYLAAGKAVVSTPGAGTELFARLMYIVDAPELFSSAISRALEEDSDQRRTERRQAVAPHSWQARAKEMFSFLLQ